MKANQPTPMTKLNTIAIRTELRPGDLGRILHLHGTVYHDERHHGVAFESIVAAGLHEFCASYDPEKERAWIAEEGDAFAGSLLLKHRGELAQLRFFLVVAEYRGIGLGHTLLELFMEFARACQYSGVYLWTTNELATAAHLYRKFGFTLTEEKSSNDFGRSVVEQRYDLIL